MKVNAPQSTSFCSTRIPFVRNKKSFTGYFYALPQKALRDFSGKSVSECLPLLNAKYNEIGVLLGKDRAIYIFGNSKSQDKYLYDRLKQFDENVEYIKDVTD